MKITVLTIFPHMFDSFLKESILGRAIAQGLLAVEPVDLRPFSDRKHKNTDDDPFGGGAGMVMLAQPILDAMAAVAPEPFHGRRIFLSPRGQTLTQKKAEALSRERELVLLCGHYEGVDQRAIDAVVDEELSLGDFVLTGGELAAMTVCDAVVRYVPGVLGSSDSTEEESFTGGLLEYPQYTRPRVFEGAETPEVLLNGDHAKIRAWRRQQSLLITAKVRPDLFENAPMSEKERQETLLLLQELQKESENHAAP